MKLTDILTEDTLPRELLDVNITSSMIAEYKDKGYVLCYSLDGKLTEFKIQARKTHEKSKTVYAITEKEFETMAKLSDNIEEFIKLHYEKIELYRKYVSAALHKLASK